MLVDTILNESILLAEPVSCPCLDIQYVVPCFFLLFVFIFCVVQGWLCESTLNFVVPSQCNDNKGYSILFYCKVPYLAIINHINCTLFKIHSSLHY